MKNLVCRGRADWLMTKGYIEFEREFAYPEAVRGLEEFSHIWIIWQFSETEKQGWSPTVRPPKLGGNERKGVFATRSPFRPNPIGLSCVKLERIENEQKRSDTLCNRCRYGGQNTYT